MIRLFVAIAIPPAIATNLESLCAGLPGARWSPAETLHVTLRFVGPAPETVAEDLDSALSVVTGAPFPMTLAGVGSFAEGFEIRSLWAGVEASDPLSRLRRRCETAARKAGLAADTRAWKPHVTLAYPRGVEPARVAAWTQSHNLFRSPAFEVERFGLYSSWRTSQGSAYRLERSYRLRP